MARLVLPLLLMAIPVIVFMAWRSLLRDRHVGPASSEVALMIGALAGAMLLAVVILVRESGEDYPDDVVWIPPHLEDGEVIPGRFAPRDAADDEPAANDEPEDASPPQTPPP